MPPQDSRSAVLVRSSLGPAEGALRLAVSVGFAAGIFALVLLAAGKNPLQAYADILSSTLTNRYGLSEVLVKMIPLLFASLAVALPARIWLINVGGEGQLYIGALVATAGALALGAWPRWALLPLLMVFAFAGGGLWAAFAGFIRARGWASETISTLLLNYVGVLLVSFFVYGPMKDPQSANYPQTAQLADGAIFPSFFNTRVHLGIVVAVLALLVYTLVLSRTRWGLEIRAIGGNAEAARRTGIPVERYIIVLLLIGGGLAGLAGLGEVSAIQGRLRPSLSPGYGYTGFLISWMAGGNPWGIVAGSFLLAIITTGGDILQMTQRIPGSVVNILMALMLFVVLARRDRGRPQR